MEVYEGCGRTIVENVLEGYNGTIFAYGQTGSGKTWTMEGQPDDPNLRGITPNAFKHIYERIAIIAEEETRAGCATPSEFLIRAQFLEIYNENVRDLLAVGDDVTKKLRVREEHDKGFVVQGLQQHICRSAADTETILLRGKANRSVGATRMNEESSRSHCIFTVIIETQSVGLDGSPHIRVGKLNLVDLAGSERQSKTGATGDRLTEAININRSLAALGNVISALVERAPHIPYRESQLTRLLKDSLGGNTKTLMIAACGPADYNFDETISTLRYADRAKQIKNKPKINEDPKDAMLRGFKNELDALKLQLAAMGQIVPGMEGVRYSLCCCCCCYVYYYYDYDCCDLERDTHHRVPLFVFVFVSINTYSAAQTRKCRENATRKDDGRSIEMRLTRSLRSSSQKWTPFDHVVRRWVMKKKLNAMRLSKKQRI